MLPRDFHRDAEYFQRYLSEIDAYITTMTDSVKTRDFPDYVTKCGAYSHLINLNYDYLLGLYSLGESIANISDVYIKQLLPCFCDNAQYGLDVPGVVKPWKMGAEKYDNYLHILSLAILLDIPDNDFQRLVNTLDTWSYNSDPIYEALLNYRVDRQSKHADELEPVMDKFYGNLLQAVSAESKQQRYALIKEYLARWYTMRRGFAMSGSHNTIENDVYSGYWSFETAALVKIWDLDDSEFKYKKYYPYDLVHKSRWDKGFPPIGVKR